MIAQLKKISLHIGCVSLIASCSSFALVACDEGTLPTVPAKVGDAGDDAQTTGDASVVRTVEIRNPFGDTSAPSNLMIDGDFELTGRSEQMPWVTLTQSGQSTLNYATGGKCKSGVRCASIAAGTVLTGYFGSPKTAGMNASLWARPDSGDCKDVQIYVFDQDSQSQTPTAQLSVVNQDAKGWCSFAGTIPNMAQQQPELYVNVSDSMKGVALIDDGVVLPADNTNSFTRSQISIDSRTRERVRFVNDWIRTHRKF